MSAQTRKRDGIWLMKWENRKTCHFTWALCSHKILYAWWYPFYNSQIFPPSNGVHLRETYSSPHRSTFATQNDFQQNLIARLKDRKMGVGRQIFFLLFGLFLFSVTHVCMDITFSRKDTSVPIMLHKSYRKMWNYVVEKGNYVRKTKKWSWEASSRCRVLEMGQWALYPLN